MAGKTLAERKFTSKVNHELKEARRPAEEAESKALLPINKSALSLAFSQYGTYLELVGLDTPVGEARTFEWPGVPDATD